jgi:hypothetical protein
LFRTSKRHNRNLMLLELLLLHNRNLMLVLLVLNNRKLVLELELRNRKKVLVLGRMLELVQSKS